MKPPPEQTLLDPPKTGYQYVRPSVCPSVPVFVGAALRWSWDEFRVLIRLIEWVEDISRPTRHKVAVVSRLACASFPRSWRHHYKIGHFGDAIPSRTLNPYKYKNKKHLKNIGPVRHCEPPHALILHCHSPGVATVARRLHIDVYDNDNDNNDNAWQRGPLWPHGMGQTTVEQCIHNVNSGGSKLQKIIKKMILPNITSPRCQGYAE